jgi:hypothetical protein
MQILTFITFEYVVWEVHVTMLNCGGLNTAVMEARVRTSPLLILKNVLTLHYIRVCENVDVSEKLVGK